MTQCLKQKLISPLILLASIVINPLSSELYAEQLFFVKVANVSDWVMEQHLDWGKKMGDERDDFFPGIGVALDKGITDKSIGWGDKEHIERSSLAEKKVVFLEGRMEELYPVREQIRITGCAPPSSENGWSIYTVDLEGLKDRADLFFVVSGGYKPYEQQLAYAGVMNPSGEIERISIRKEATKEDREKVAFIVTQSDFNFHFARSDGKNWLDSKLPMEYGVGLLVIERDKNYPLDTDKCLIKVHLDKGEFKEKGVNSISVVLGWRDEEIRNLPSLDTWGGRDRSNFGGGVSK